jgi:hypothetical protein
MDRLDVVESRHEKDRDARAGVVRANTAARLEAIHAGHDDVEYDQIRRLALESLYGRGAVLRFDDVESCVLESRDEYASRRCVVVRE